MVRYIRNLFVGIWRLMQGMYVVMLNFIRPKVTEQYPENRGKVFPHERMRGRLIMPHNEENQHKCTACGICETNCPNGTIQVISKKELDEEQGKRKERSINISTISDVVSIARFVPHPVPRMHLHGQLILNMLYLQKAS